MSAEKGRKAGPPEEAHAPKGLQEDFLRALFARQSLPTDDFRLMVLIRSSSAIEQSPARQLELERPRAHA